LGGGLFAVKNNQDANACIVDVEAGKVLWKLDDCFDGNDGLCIGDDNAVYVAREAKARRFLTAHKRETGEEIWNCYLSTSYNQFCSPLTQNEKYIFHTNSTQIYVVEKETGKLVNKFKVAHNDIESGTRIVLPWKDKVLYGGWTESGKGKNKQTSFALSLYDPAGKDNAFIEDVIVIDGAQEVMHMELLNDKTLFFLSRYDAVLRIIDLDAKDICFEHDFAPDCDRTMSGYGQGYMSQIAYDGDKFHFMVMATDTDMNEAEEYVIHKNFRTFDFQEKTLTGFDDAGTSRYNHYYYDGALVNVGFSTFKSGDMENGEATGIEIKRILSMKVIDERFYLLQDNEDETVNIIVLTK
jgi:outer membrane protein assembly factor BamB